MKLGELPSFILFVLDKETDEEIEKVWLASPLREGSFNDFKAEVLRENNVKTQTKDEVEMNALAAKDKALSNLLNFNGSEVLNNGN